MDKKRAIFLDRDGVLNETIDRGENCIVAGKKVRDTAPWKLSEFKLFDGVSEELERLRNAGFITILVSNQPDLAYKTLSLDVHKEIMARVSALPLDDIYICPHGRNEECDCKKPKPGMLLRAAQKWNIDLPNSYMIGDTENDIKAGETAQCKTILITAGNLKKAVDTILDL